MDLLTPLAVRNERDESVRQALQDCVSTLPAFSADDPLNLYRLALETPLEEDIA